MKGLSMLKNKKAQEINITTIIIVILAVLALVVLVLGFTMGWNQLWAKVTGGQNVTQGTDTDWDIADCNAKCSSNDVGGYCSAECDKIVDPRLTCTSITCTDYNDCTKLCSDKNKEGFCSKCKTIISCSGIACS